MSLDVYLTMPGAMREKAGGKIFVREAGQTKEISREEWEQAFPGREPVTVEVGNPEEVFSANITHNLNKMADAVGIYQHLWRPDELGIKKAGELIEPLKAGLAKMKAEPERFKLFNPDNGWGSYDGFLPWIERYLEACVEWPEATISVSR